MTRFYVEADGWLIQEKKAGIAANGQRKKNPLFLPSGENSEFPFTQIFEAGNRQSFRDGKRFRIIRRKQIDVLAHSQRLWDSAHLQHRANANMGFGERWVAAEYRDVA